MPRISRFRSTGFGGRRFLRKGNGGGGWKRGRTVPGAGTKTVDIKQVGAVALSIGGAGVINLNGIAEGPGFYQRVGRTICMKSFYISGYVLPNAATPPDKMTVLRMAVIYDAQANGSTPVWADVFKSYDNAGGVQSFALDQINPDNKDRFKLLCDWRTPLLPCYSSTSTIPAGTPGFNNPSNLYFQRYCPLKNLETKYNASTAVSSAIMTGALWLFAGLDNQGGITNPWYITYTCRLRYCDL